MSLGWKGAVGPVRGGLLVQARSSHQRQARLQMIRTFPHGAVSAQGTLETKLIFCKRHSRHSIYIQIQAAASLSQQHHIQALGLSCIKGDEN